MELFLIACHGHDDAKLPQDDSATLDSADTADSTDSVDSVDTSDTSDDCPPLSTAELYDLYDHDGDGYLSADTPACLLEKILNHEISVDDDVYNHVLDDLWDCDDEVFAVNPGAAEICGNGTNDDCSTTTAAACRVGDLNLEDAPSKVSGATANRQMGEAIASAGDLDDDGYNDLVLGVPQTGVTDYGYVLIFSGQDDLVTMTDAWTTLQGPTRSDGTGFAVAIAGDVNGDAVPDLAISRIYDGAYGTHAGAVELLYGPITSGTIGALPGITIFGEAANERFGARLITLGDVDGDGFAEIAAGSLGSDDVGVISVFDGRDVTTGLASITGDAITQFVGQPGDGVGANGVVTDLDGDGVLDLVVGAPNADGAVAQSGAVYVFYDVGRRGVIATEDADVRILGETSDAKFGIGVASATGQDYDGDGNPDLLVGESENSTYANLNGAAYVYTSLADGDTSADADLQVFSQTEDAQLGYSIAFANLDGFSSDIFLGAPAKTSDAAIGEVWQVYAPQGGVLIAPDAKWTGFNEIDASGYTVQNLGDINGSGCDAIAVGSPQANRIASHGGVVSVVVGVGE